MRHHLLELQQQLRDNNVEPKQSPYLSTRDPYQWASQGSFEGSWNSSSQGNGAGASAGVRKVERDEKGESNMFALPTFRGGCNGDNYLGVSSPNSFLSPIKGTSLSVFGMEVDLAHFFSEDFEQEQSPTSYTKLLELVASGPPSMEPPPGALLPQSLPECQGYAQTYLAVLNPWLPILHEPSLQDLVSYVLLHRFC